MSGNAGPAAASAFKSRGGLRRLYNASGYTMRGMLSAWRNEAAFRQEIIVGLPLILAAPVLASERWQAALLIGAILLVWLVELLNSAIEAICDAVSLERHPLLGRAKDMGSAAVFVSIVLAVVVWTSIL